MEIMFETLKTVSFIATAVMAVMGALKAWAMSRQVTSMRVEINGRMEELLKAAVRAAASEAKLEALKEVGAIVNVAVTGKTAEAVP